MLGKSIAKIGSWRPRAPFKPITVGALADLEVPDFAFARNLTQAGSGKFAIPSSRP